MKKSTLLALGILALGILVSVLLVALSPEPVRRSPPVQTPLVQTISADVRTGALVVAGSGTVRPKAEVDLSPQVSGSVVYVSPALVSGGQIRRGQVLVRIEAADYQNALRQAEADVAQQQVNLLQTEEEARIARTEYERFRTREQARRTSAADTAGPSGLVLREPQQAAAKAALARADAVRDNAQLALSRTQIVAPFDGYVRSENVDRGQFVAAGQPIARLYAADEVEVVVPLSTDEAALIPNLWTKQAGQNNTQIPATVFMAYGGQRYQWSGYVDRAEAALDATTRTIDMVIRVPKPFAGGTPVGVPGEVDLMAKQAPPLLVGQYVSVQLNGVELDQYAALPREALRAGDEVWTVAQDSVVHIVPVQVLQKIGSEVFVLGSIKPTDAIIISDLTAATEGMRVRIASGS